MYHVCVGIFNESECGITSTKLLEYSYWISSASASRLDCSDTWPLAAPFLTSTTSSDALRAQTIELSRALLQPLRTLCLSEVQDFHLGGLIPQASVSVV